MDEDSTDDESRDHEEHVDTDVAAGEHDLGVVEHDEKNRETAQNLDVGSMAGEWRESLCCHETLDPLVSMCGELNFPMSERPGNSRVADGPGAFNHDPLRASRICERAVGLRALQARSLERPGL